jgi:hypothetical protein
VLLAGALLALALVFLFETLRFNPASRIVPLSVLIPLVPLLLYCLGRAVGEARRQRDAGSVGATPHATGETRLIAWVLALPFLATVVGAVVGPALFVGAWLRFRGGERWPAVFTGAAVTAAMLVALMAGLLGTTPAEAMLPVWIRR